MIGSGVRVRGLREGVTQDIRMMCMYYCSKFEMTTKLCTFFLVRCKKDNSYIEKQSNIGSSK